MRAPFELACKPAASSMMPALTISSLNFAILASISSDGILPASDSLLALTITMKRIVSLLVWILCDSLVQRVRVHSADFGRSLRLAALHLRKARPDARIGDAHRRPAFARAASIGRNIQHGEHGQRDRREHEITRLEFDHLSHPVGWITTCSIKRRTRRRRIDTVAQRNLWRHINPSSYCLY